jgi:uncharacterized protein (TIGR00369 family)
LNKELQKQLMDVFNHSARIAKTFGMTLSYTEEGNAVFDMPYNPNFDHALDGIHGGVYATMIDNAGWFTSAAAQETGCWVATSELSIRFLEPAQKTSLRSVGKLIKKGKRLDIAQMHLYDGNGRLVGHGTGTFIVLSHIPFAKG